MTINLHQFSYYFSTRRYKQDWKVGNPLVWRDAHQVITRGVCCIYTTKENMVKDCFVLCE